MSCSFLLLGCDDATVFFVTQANGVNIDVTYKTAPNLWKGTMSFVARDKHMNNMLIFKVFLTHERETMFTKISEAILKYCGEIITIRSIENFVHVKAIMTDLTSHCGRQFQHFLSPDCHLGHTLYHVTACIQKNLFKDKKLKKLFYKDAVARGYMRSLMYISFSPKSMIS